jgi:type II secretory pathway pseudopilin PulG
MKINTAQQNEYGVTVFELLIVFIIILVLGAFIGTTYAGIREKQRNTVRETNLALIKNKLELYYAEFYKYPSLSEINNPSWRAANLNNFDSNLLKDPSSSKENLVSRPMSSAYAYVATTPDGTGCDNVSKNCAEYTLVATLEGGGTFSKSSLN